MRSITLFFLVIILAASCGPSTKIVKSWKDPDATITTTPDTKVFVVAMVKDETARRVIEDQLAKRLKGKGVQSYTMLSADQMKNGDSTVLQKILQDGRFTHVLLMRLADVEKEVSYVPGTTTGFYGGYGHYYGYGAGFYSTPGYYNVDKNYYVETAIYTVNPDKLIWTSVTTTVNPSNTEKAVNEIADVVVDKMKKEGLVAK